MKSSTDLQRLLESVGRRSYLVCKDARSSYDFNDHTLSIGHVQEDPFASPSKLSVWTPHEKAGYSTEYFDTLWKQTALEDHIIRRFHQEIAAFNFKTKGSGKSGLTTTSRPSPEILSCMACKCGSKGITTRFKTGFPANGRATNSRELIKTLLNFLLHRVKHVFYSKNRKPEEMLSVVHLAGDQQFIRHELERLDPISLVANETALPREGSISSRPMKGSIPLSSPQSLRTKLDLPHHGRLTGMRLRWGITLVVGGGYHDKSTLLEALEAGVYNHVVGDGREYMVTNGTVMKLRAEGGKGIQNTDISLFINDLPNKRNIKCLSTKDASRSTPQTATMVEGTGAGSRAFLIDEDAPTTDFMIRDDLTQKTISRSREPIAPFIERARDLYENADISVIMVVGGSDAYFYIADTVIQMDCHEPLNITDRIKAFCASYDVEPITRAPGFAPPARRRRPQTGTSTSGLPNSGLSASGRSGQFQNAQPGEHGKSGYHQGGSCGHGRDGRDGTRGGYGSQGGREERIKVKIYGKDSLQVGKSPVDLRLAEQLTDSEQTNVLAQMLRYCVEHQLLERCAAADTVTLLEKEIEKGGIATVNDTSYVACGPCMPRT